MKEIKDIKLGKNMEVKELARQLGDSGFQAQNLGKAIDIIKEMIKEDAAVFLSFTSNMAASGLRGIIISMIRSGRIKAIVTSSGSIDEDIIRAKLPYLQGSFESDDAKLGREGINRMGNIFVPNDRYQYLEEFSSKVLEEIYKEKKSRISLLVHAFWHTTRHSRCSAAAFRGYHIVYAQYHFSCFRRGFYCLRLYS